MKSQFYKLTIQTDIDPDSAWILLEEAGYHPCSLTIETGSQPWLLLLSDKQLTLAEVRKNCSFVSQIDSYEAAQEIQWEEQWATHAPGWKNGYLWLTVGERELKLCSGPGFGDLSHPTTQLCLQLLQEELLKGQIVLDIGCGSGILSLAAAALGATVYGIDIDPAAIEHAQRNADLNQLTIFYGLAQTLKLPKNSIPLVVINMIASEQRVARCNIPPSTSKLITSGILAAEQKSYIDELSSQGWQLTGTYHLDGWCGFTWTR